MITQIVTGLAIVAGAAWGAPALWFQSPYSGRARAVLPTAWLALAAAALIGLFIGQPLPAWLFGALLLALLAWWRLGVRPSNERPWMPEVARQTQGAVEGDIVTLNNVRNFDWHSRTDYDIRWETRSYDLSRLESVDLALSYWGRPAIAHAMVSFGFGDGQHVVFSVEIRRKLHDVFSEVGGFFRQYELAVLASTEEDSLRVRTNVRGEEGYLYRVHMPEGAARKLFLSYVETATRLVRKPRFYNTLTGNCITIVYRLADQIVPGLPLDYRLLLSGYLPEYLYRLDALEGADSLQAYRQAGHYTQRARATVDAAEFSRNIRRGVPGVPQAAAPDQDAATMPGAGARSRST
ncbi:Lnb N-terminal periplasmic domain-containing protein [Achromobacter aegrifaciens]